MEACSLGAESAPNQHNSAAGVIKKGLEAHSGPSGKNCAACGAAPACSPMQEELMSTPVACRRQLNTLPGVP